MDFAVELLGRIGEYSDKYSDPLAASDEISSQILTVMRREKTIVMRRFNKITATWRHKPSFMVQEYLSLGLDDMSVTVSTDDEIYAYLNDGTEVRYATMTPGFISKTEPDWIGSRTGNGGLWFVSTYSPKPGIEARKWDKAIAEDRQAKFQRNLERAVMRGLRKHFGF